MGRVLVGLPDQLLERRLQVDGVRVGTYSWQWENYDWPGEFSPEVLIHETGHALGLPDYYDYDDAIGPKGGVGGLDQMDGNWGDHNAFSKWVLGWLTPEIYNQESHELLLPPSDAAPHAAVMMHGDPVTDPYAEYYLVQHRRRQGNDANLPNDGLLIWHIDARLDADGSFLYDNSYTEHKLIRLMEADGLEEISRGGRADAGDFYTPGDIFDTETTPASLRHDGVPTNIAIGSIAVSGEDLSLQADLGSGCALWCDASVTPNAWPGLPVSFNGSLATANCDGSASYGWVFGDGATSGDTSATHAFVSSGSYDWNVTAELADATCGHAGSVLVCTGFPCWQWTPSEPMAAARISMPRSNSTTAGFSSSVGVPGRRRSSIPRPRPGPRQHRPTVGESRPRPHCSMMAGSWWLGAAPTTSPTPRSTTRPPIPGRPPASSTTTASPTRPSPLPTDGCWWREGIVNDSGHYESAEEVEVFDPASETWTVVGTLTGQRLYPGLANLHDGRTVIAGARELTVFDPLSDTLSRAAVLPADWQAPIAVTLDDGRVLLTAIAGAHLTLLWNPADGKWNLAGPTGTLRQRPTATKLPNGLVLVAGGTDMSGSPTASTEFFDPATKKWSTGSSLTTGRGDHAATADRWRPTPGDRRSFLRGGHRSDRDPRSTDNPAKGNRRATLALITAPRRASRARP